MNAAVRATTAAREGMEAHAGLNGAGGAPWWTAAGLAVADRGGNGAGRNAAWRPGWPGASDNADDEQEEAERHVQFEREALVHLDLLYNSAMQMTHNAADAQDLVQDTFVKAYRFFDKYKAGTNCKAWLFRIMKNTFINSFRKRSRQPVRVDFNDVEPILKAKQPVDEHADRSLPVMHRFDEVVDDDIKRALDQLPFEFRMATVLCDIEGLSYQEIAEIMDCPIGTVRSRLSRARRFLQRRLNGFAVEHGIIKSEDGDE
ncbi:MAG: sigma-70 family RNA polymerase sigma factor [Verrucomicrobia bacterium]|nr:sigma-70 family RNA polymerase sigma factor [Verrucomicrobiota bacterium]